MVLVIMLFNTPVMVRGNFIDEANPSGIAPLAFGEERELISVAIPSGFESINFGDTRWTGNIYSDIAILCYVVDQYWQTIRFPDEIVMTFLPFDLAESALSLYYLGESGNHMVLFNFEDFNINRMCFAQDNKTIEVTYEEDLQRYMVNSAYTLNHDEINRQIDLYFSDDFIKSVVSIVNFKHSVQNVQYVNLDIISNVQLEMNSFLNDFKKYHSLADTIDEIIPRALRNSSDFRIIYNDLFRELPQLLALVNMLDATSDYSIIVYAYTRFVSMRHFFNSAISNVFINNHDFLVNHYYCAMEAFVIRYGDIDNSLLCDPLIAEHERLNYTINEWLLIFEQFSLEHCAIALEKLNLNLLMMKLQLAHIEINL